LSLHLSRHIPGAEYKVMSHEDVEECNDNQWNGVVCEELYHHHYLSMNFSWIWGAYLWKQNTSILVSLEDKDLSSCSQLDKKCIVD
jgi:hypothetical protein